MCGYERDAAKFHDPFEFQLTHHLKTFDGHRFKGDVRGLTV